MYHHDILTFTFPCRHQFYLQARVELMNSYLVAQEIKSAIQVCALAAQAELGDASGTLSTTDFYLNCLPNLPWSSKTPDATQCSLLKKDTVKPIDTTKEDWISAVLQQHLSLKVCFHVLGSDMPDQYPYFQR